MPCAKYKSKKQRGLCYSTRGWKDWKKVRNPDLKKKHNAVGRKLTSGARKVIAV